MEFQLKIYKVFLIILLFIFSSCGMYSHQEVEVKPKLPSYLQDYDTAWVDSVFSQMTFDEKLGQLFMPYVYSNKGQAHIDKQKELIKKYNIGGFIWMQGTPRKQIQYYNQLQSVSKYPLMFSIDAERGLAMRLDSVHQFPYQMTMGALSSDSLIYQMAQQCAKHCRLVGAHINFAPVVDVNNNPNNPIINIRAFGAQRQLVARKGIVYMNGLQENGVLACAKHFPGHGDTDKDSHLSLPIIKHDSSRLDSVELYPFKALIHQGCGSVMTAHLHIPTYDSTKNKAASLSANVVNTLLKKELEFQGLSFTDALNMHGVSKYYEAGQLELEALKAGNDILLFSSNIAKAFNEIKKAILDSVIDSNYIAFKAYKVLQLKSWLKIEDELELSDSILALLNDTISQKINTHIYKDAIYWQRQDSNWQNAEVIEVFCKSKFAYKNYGLDQNFIDSINARAQKSNILVVLYGSSLAVNRFPDVQNILVANRKTNEVIKEVKTIIENKRLTSGINPISY